MVEVDHAGAAAFSASCQAHTRFPKSSCSLNDIASLRVLHQLVLESPIIVVADQRCNDSGKARKLDEF